MLPLCKKKIGGRILFIFLNILNIYDLKKIRVNDTRNYADNTHKAANDLSASYNAWILDKIKKCIYAPFLFYL